MSEYDDQMARFEKGIAEPDEIIEAHSMLQADGDEATGYYFLTEDSRCVLVRLPV